MPVMPPEFARPLVFHKMHGLGNDFVIIDTRTERADLCADLVRAIGDRHFGVGFDQLAEILPASDNTADADLRFWNADGSISGACGNATRCVADLLMHETGAGQVRLRTPHGVLEAKRRGDGLIEVNMGQAHTRWDTIPLARPMDTVALELEGAPGAVSMGNPHCVYFVADAQAAALEKIGPATETHPLFPEHTNVQIAQVLAPDAVRVRVWERGVGPTLASGSSACAVVVAGARKGVLSRRATVHLDGGTLHIHWREDGEVIMAGPVSYVFTGTLDRQGLIARARA